MALPDATLLHFDGDVQSQSILNLVKDKYVIIFGVPGAYTGTCSNAHIPSFIKTADALKEKGVDEIICVSVNDPFVLSAWGDATGAKQAGIRLLADAEV